MKRGNENLKKLKVNVAKAEIYRQACNIPSQKRFGRLQAAEGSLISKYGLIRESV
jgi:hypothetical protein